MDGAHDVFETNVVQVVGASNGFNEPILWWVHVLCEQNRLRHVDEARNWSSSEFTICSELRLRFQDKSVKAKNNSFFEMIQIEILISPLQGHITVFFGSIQVQIDPAVDGLMEDHQYRAYFLSTSRHWINDDRNFKTRQVWVLWWDFHNTTWAKY